MRQARRRLDPDGGFACLPQQNEVRFARETSRSNGVPMTLLRWLRLGRWSTQLSALAARCWGARRQPRASHGCNEGPLSPERPNSSTPTLVASAVTPEERLQRVLGPERY